ncbi:MAG TPA: hypothetical protein VIT68_03410 [Candidatus Gracilibacteria bacterium]
MKRVLFSFIALLFYSTAHAAVGDTVLYQARLLNADLTPKTGNYDVRVSLWGTADAPNGTETDITGNLWNEVQTIALDNDGKLTLQVGNVTPLPTPLDPTIYGYFQVDVKPSGGPTYTILNPFPSDITIDRKPLSSVAFAQNAATVAGRSIGLGADQIPYLDGSGQLAPSMLTSITTASDNNTTNIGDLTYTEDNYIIDSEPLSDSIDTLDQQVKDNADAITTNQTNITNNTNALSTANTNLGNLTYTEDNYVTDAQSVTASIDALDQQLKDTIDSGATTLSALGARTYTTQNYVSNGETITASLDALDLQLKATADSLANISADEITDADNNTKVQVEASANEDKIRFDIAGSEIALMDSNGISLTSGVVTTNLKSLGTHGEIGTTSASDFRLKVNDLSRINLLAGGDTAYGVNATTATANHDFYGSVRVRGQLIDGAGNGGTAEQILVSNGSGTEWRSAPTTKIITQASHGFSITNNIPLPAYINGSGDVVLALADNQNTLTAFYITQIIDTNNFQIKMNGLHTASSHGLSVGQYYFLSESTPAATTLTSPNLSDVVFYILDADTIYLKDNRPFNTTP